MKQKAQDAKEKIAENLPSAEQVKQKALDAKDYVAEKASDAKDVVAEKATQGILIVVCILWIEWIEMFVIFDL